MMEGTSQRVLAVLIAVAMLAAITALLLETKPIRADVVPRAAAPARVEGVSLTNTASDLSPMVTTDGAGRVVSSGSTIAAATRFKDLYPSQAKATRNSSDPASNYWALLIGINAYAGSTRDNIGSYQDARDLRKHLRSLGWKSDHIVLLANTNATASMIIQSIRWLRSKANSSSVVVFHYSGHQKPVRSSADGDNERRDQAIHASDNRLVLDGTLGKEMNRVRAAKMWINLSLCRAGGFRDPGMIKTGRVLTFASPERELAYEDPTVKHSVFGWYEIYEGMMRRKADKDRNGHVTVEEAYKYARPYTIRRTSGRQHPFIVDKLSGNLTLKPPRPAPPPQPSQPPPSQNCIVIICTGAARREGF